MLLKKFTSVDLRTVVHFESFFCVLGFDVNDFLNLLGDLLFTDTPGLLFGSVLA